MDLKAVVVKRSKSKESQNYSARASNIHKINRNQFYSRIKSRILHVQHFLFKCAHGNYCMQKCQCVTCFICMKKLCSYRQSSAPLCVHPTTTALCARGECNSTALCAWGYSNSIAKHWFEKQQLMQKSNVHVVISRLSELSSWTRGTQCQVRFADLKTKQPPLIGTFPFPNTGPMGL